MINPLETVPLNTKSVYVVGTTLDGCKVYMPVDSLDEDEAKLQKEILQHYLNHQYVPLPEPDRFA